MARSFNGSNANLQISSTFVTPPFTMACWFKNSSLPSPLGLLMSIGYSVATNNRYMLYVSSSNSVGCETAAGSGTSTASVSPETASLNVWNHACGVWAGTNSRKVYLNGDNSSTVSTINLTPSTNTTNIGALRTTSGLTWHFNGLIAIPAIWNVALTDDEVLALSRGALPSQVRPQNLISFNLFDPRNLDIIGSSWTNTGSTDSFDNPPLR